MEWVRFFLTAVLLVLGLAGFASAVLGNFRFGFVMNRIHAAGIGDTLGLLCTAVAVMIGTGDPVMILKLILIVVFQWCTSPISTHFLAQIEYHMNRHLDDYVEREDEYERD